MVDWKQLGQALLEAFLQQVQKGFLDFDQSDFEKSGKFLKRLEETLKFLDNLRNFLERKEDFDFANLLLKRLVSGGKF